MRRYFSGRARRSSPGEKRPVAGPSLRDRIFGRVQLALTDPVAARDLPEAIAGAEAQGWRVRQVIYAGERDGAPARVVTASDGGAPRRAARVPWYGLLIARRMWPPLFPPRLKS